MRGSVCIKRQTTMIRAIIFKTTRLNMYLYNPGAKKTRFDCGFLRLNIKKFDQ